MIIDELHAEEKTTDELSYRSYFVATFDKFSIDDARSILRAARLAGGGAARSMLAFYPLAETKWHELARDNWTTVTRARFRRRGLIGVNDVDWIVGFDPDNESFARVLEWAWRSSMCETLLVIVGDPAKATVAVDVFQDDWGDAEVNEAALLPYFDPIFARTHEGNHLRITTSRLHDDDVRALFA